VSSVGWRSIFWINVPIGISAVVLTLAYIPESRAQIARRVDIIGQLLVIVLLTSLTYGVIEAPDRGWSSGVIVGTLAVAAVSLVGLILCEHRVSDPLIDLRFFRSIPFSSSTVIAVASFAALGGFLFLNTLYLQDVRGLSALRAGIDTLPMAVMIMLLPPISGRMVGRRGSRTPLVVAGIALGVSCLMLVGLSATTPFAWLFTAYVVFGIGFGFVNAPITNAAVSGMPRAQAGVAAAIASTSRQIGQTLGVAVVGALVSSSLSKGSRLDFSTASRAGWWVLSGCGLAVLILGVVATSERARATAQRTAEVLNPEFLEGHTP
jgi:MFS family permease